MDGKQLRLQSNPFAGDGRSRTPRLKIKISNSFVSVEGDGFEEDEERDGVDNSINEH